MTFYNLWAPNKDVYTVVRFIEEVAYLELAESC